jgi:hypothetical protein
MAEPAGLTILNEELWHLPPSEAKAFWWALCRSRYLRPTLLRQQLGLAGHMLVTDDCLARLCQPALVLAALEALVHEGHLRRAQCTRMEDTILSHVQANGSWRGELGDGVARATVHAPDVQTLAETGTE